MISYKRVRKINKCCHKYKKNILKIRTESVTTRIVEFRLDSHAVCRIHRTWLLFDMESKEMH